MEIETIYGVDFSGSSTAGENIWITEATPRDHGLVIESVQRVDDSLDLESTSRDIVLPELLDFVISQDSSVAFGFDFPFSLPAAILSEDDWWKLIVRFPDEFLSPENLQRVCSDRARVVTSNGIVHLNRETESDFGALCPYSLQVRKQTYYGIRDLLRPLALTGSARVLPMMSPEGSLPAVVEVYPSGTLSEHEGLPERGYKSNSNSAKEKREQIVEEFLMSESGTNRIELIEDDEADGIDSLVAATAVNENLEAISDERTDPQKSVEGHIYV